MPDWPLLDRFWTDNTRGHDTDPPLDADGYLAPLPRVPLARTEGLAALGGCRVLLGEAGLGKSTALGRIRDGLPADTPRVVVDLADVGSAADLHTRVFTGAGWDQWRGGSDLHLVLDSVDESRAAIDRGAVAVRSGFRNLVSTDRLTLVVACRSGAWPPTLADALAAAFPGRYGEHHLCPLRRDDVRSVAAAEGLPADAFLAALDAAAAHPLAARPHSLRLLVRMFREGGRLPTTRGELYRRAVEALCEEGNPAYRDNRPAGRLAARQRVAVAGRVAAVTVFAARPGVWTGPPADAADEFVPLAELSGGEEGGLPVAEAAVAETLADTGLFAADGAGRVRWAHRSFAEFLAAEHLAARGLPDAALDGLFLHPSRLGVRTELAGTAGWAGATRPDWFGRLSEHDPRLLHELDPSAPADRRAAAAGRLIAAAAADRVLDRRLWETDYRRFRSAGLGAVLRRTIADRGGHRIARRMAMRMAAGAAAAELLPDLLAVAADPADDTHLRAVAARSAIELSGDDPPAGLRGLLRLPPTEDPDDELLGTALDALWPARLSAGELFAALRSPHNPNFFGEYQGFLLTLAGRLPAADLPAALAWAAGTFVPDRYEIDPRPRLHSEIVIRGAAAIDAPGVASGLARAVWAYVREHVSLPAVGDDCPDLLAAAGVRRAVAAHLIPLAAADPSVNAPSAANRIAYARLLRPDDLGWALAAIETLTDASARSVLAAVIDMLYRPDDPDALARLLAVHRSAAAPAELRPILDPLFTPIAIRSPEADALRQAYRRHAERVTQYAEQDRGHATARGRREQAARDEWAAALSAVRTGAMDAWPLAVVAAIRIAQSDTEAWVSPEWPDMPGWAGLVPDDDPLLDAAAERFLSEATTGPIVAGLKALHRLRTRLPECFHALGDAAWRTWLPAVTWYAGTGRRSDAVRALFEAGLAHVPDVALSLVERLMASIHAAGHRIDPTWLLARCEGEAVVAFHRRLLAAPAGAWAYGRLLERLIALDPAAAAAEIDARLADGAADRAVRFEAATGRAALDPPGFVRWLHAAEAAAPGFVADWVLHVFGPDAASRTAGRLLDGLTPAELGNLYRLVAAALPPAGDPDHPPGGFVVTPRDEAVTFRRSILGRLENRGGPAAVEVLTALAADRPDDDGLRWRAVLAREATLTAAEERPSSAELLALFADAGRRLVRGPADLADLIVESLGRFQQELQGHTPAAFQLWDEAPDSTFRPKNENRLSDAIALHLRRDLGGRRVAINREVEVRPRHGAGGRPGERTDIQVDASGPDGGTFTVIVEVKGGWNADVDTAMRDQLRDRYLADSGLTHGVYVIGRFDCPQWAAERNRTNERRNLNGDLAAVRRRFDAQAEAVSTPAARLRAVVLDARLR